MSLSEMYELQSRKQCDEVHTSQPHIRVQVENRKGHKLTDALNCNGSVKRLAITITAGETFLETTCALPPSKLVGEGRIQDDSPKMVCCTLGCDGSPRVVRCNA